MQTDTIYRTNYLQSEKFIYQQTKAGFGKNLRIGVATIPVVVHVIHLGEPVGIGTNISDAQIIGAIDGANDRFRGRIGAGVDLGVEFCLAQRDPDGNPTNGIDRVDFSAVPNYASGGVWSQSTPTGINDSILFVNHKWDSSRYYNIYVVNKIAIQGAGGYGASGYFVNPYYKEGIVLAYQLFTYNDQALTHELGHGFGLHHTFEGDGGDLYCPIDTNCLLDGDGVCDTKPHKQSDCLTTSCSGTGLFTNSVTNYMSYCFPVVSQAQFTAGQLQRVQIHLTYFIRPHLKLSDACTPVSAIDAAISAVNYPDNEEHQLISMERFNPVITLKNYGSDVLTSCNIYYNLDNSPTVTYNWSGLLSKDSFALVTLPFINTLAVGDHSLLIYLRQPNGISGNDAYTLNDSAFVSFTYLIVPDSICEEFSSVTSSFPQYWNIFPVVDTINNWKLFNLQCKGNVMGINRFDNPNSSGIVDLVSPPFKTQGYSELILSFDRASIISYSNAASRLQIICSDNLGRETILFDKSYSDLASVSGFNVTAPWYPQNCNEWRTESIKICPQSADEFALIFRAYGGMNYQNLFLDNICIDTKPLPDAGNDTAQCSSKIYLNANNAPGSWSIVSASGTGTTGTFSNTNSPTSQFSGTQSTSYLLQWGRFDNQCNTSYFDTVSVSFIGPYMELNLPFNSICNNLDSAELTGGMPPGGEYSLNSLPGNIIYPSQLTPGADTVWYIYTDTLTQCIGIISKIIQIDVCSAIEEPNSFSVNIYPNPATQIIFMQVSSAHFNKATIYDLTGREIIHSEQPFLALENFSAGIYICKVELEKESNYFKKLVIK